MRHLKIIFEDDIFDGMKALKKKLNLTWEQFIIKSVWEKHISVPEESESKEDA